MDIYAYNLCPSRDHIIPKKKTKGVPNRRVIIVCMECNSLKGALTLDEFLTVLKDNRQRLLELTAINTNRVAHLSYLIDMGLK